MHARAGAGELEVLGTRREGVAPVLDVVSDPAAANGEAPRIDLDVSVGLGSVLVTRLHAVAGVVFIAFGVVALLDGFGVVTVRLTVLLPVVLVLAGVALMVAAASGPGAKPSPTHR